MFFRRVLDSCRIQLLGKFKLKRFSRSMSLVLDPSVQSITMNGTQEHGTIASLVENGIQDKNSHETSGTLPAGGAVLDAKSRQANTESLSKEGATNNSCFHYDRQSQTMEAPTHFYRRELPSTCIAFSSEEGKLIFRQALEAGYMNSYFSLASQFRTQEEPAYCGLSTLVMVLNALAVDPGIVWKGPWRWYHEDMLECCVPLQIVQKKGITLREFVCLAICNNLNVRTTYVDHNASLDNFRTLVKQLTQVDDQVLVCSYSRPTLGQSGEGHFSPIGGYDPERDLVLLMDVARFKYPPHWVALSLLWEAMKTVDSETGCARGYCVLTQNQTSEPMVLFRTSPHLSVTVNYPSSIQSFLGEWETWLNAPVPSDWEESQKHSLLDSAILALIDDLSLLGDNDALFSTQIDLLCIKAYTQDHLCCVENLVKALMDTDLYKRVELISSKENADQQIRRIWVPAVMHDADRERGELLSENLNNSIFLTVLMFAWPYKELSPPEGGAATRGTQLKRILHAELDVSQFLLKNEMDQLSKLLTVVLKKYYHCKECGCSKFS